MEDGAQAYCGIDADNHSAVRSSVPSPRRPLSSAPKNESGLQFRIRLMHRGEIALGPGKAELLVAIRDNGSLAKGAKKLGMSYMRAWTLVRIMNKSFREPLIELERGGAKGGAARLTPLGHEALNLYHRLVARSLATARPLEAKLQKWLAP
jgi:molybdate transport system regulatory protein